MAALFRIALTVLFGWLMWSAARDSHGNLGQDVANAGRFGLAIVVGFAAAITWAPLIGRKIAGPLTGTMTDGSVAHDTTGLIRWARRFEARKWRWATLLLCFCEGVRHPDLPAAFVVGMNNARPGSWLRKVFARETWKFHNVANCLKAHHILAEEFNVRLTSHPVPEVNLAIRGGLREERPEPAALSVPTAPPARPLQRKAGIRLFTAADAPPPPAEDP